MRYKRRLTRRQEIALAEGKPLNVHDNSKLDLCKISSKSPNRRNLNRDISQALASLPNLDRETKSLIEFGGRYSVIPKSDTRWQRIIEAGRQGKGKARQSKASKRAIKGHDIPTPGESRNIESPINPATGLPATNATYQTPNTPKVKRVTAKNKLAKEGKATVKLEVKFTEAGYIVPQPGSKGKPIKTVPSQTIEAKAALTNHRRIMGTLTLKKPTETTD